MTRISEQGSGRPSGRLRLSPRLPAVTDAAAVSFANGCELLRRQWLAGPAGNAFWTTRVDGLGALHRELVGGTEARKVRRLADNADRLLRGVSLDEVAIAPVIGRWQVFVHVVTTDLWVPFGWAGPRLPWVLEALVASVDANGREPGCQAQRSLAPDRRPVGSRCRS